MSSKAMKIIIGILVAALVLVGSLAILKSTGVFDNKGGGNETSLMEEGELGATLTPATPAGGNSAA